MLLVVGSTADLLRVEGEATAVADPRVPNGVRLREVVSTQRTEATCPACGQRATRVHSRYRRTLADLALQGVPVTLTVTVRRFRCDHRTCPRLTFVEPLGDFAAPRAQRTQRLTAMQTQVGLALGGAAGARLLPALGAPASPATVLRLVHRATPPVAPTPRVLGVDDWALRRGHRYGTVLIDLERRQPVDLLPDREADTLAQWLREHPGVEIISRDRAEAYALAARKGAPDAMQIADRWHLLKNTGDVLERILHRHRGALQDAALAAADLAQPAAAATPPVPTTAPSPRADERAARSAHQQVLYERIHALHAEGASLRGIADRLGLSRVTVRKYLRAPACPRRAPPRPPRGVLADFTAHLRQRWDAGGYNTTQLWMELRTLGFRGSLRTVRRHVQSWPVPTGVRYPPRRVPSAGASARAPAALKAPSPRVVRWWLLLPVTRLSLEQCLFVDHLTSHCAAVRTAQDLATDFGQLMRARRVDALEPWLCDAERSSHTEFRELAASLRRDHAAVEAAVRETWSNGQTEGQVNKIKMLKRQTYGRASVALLRQRLLCAA